MGDGTFCRICHRLMVPNREQICGDCQDAMKRAGYEKVVHCEECKHGGCRTHKLDGSVYRVVCKKHGTKKNELWMPADFYCYDGERKETE